MQKTYNIINNTYYSTNTPQEVINILENSRQYKKRLKIYLGDNKTGIEWGDVEIGHIGRSCGGKYNIPLIIKNSRSMGGCSLLDDCIVKIEYANKKDGGIIYNIIK